MLNSSFCAGDNRTSCMGLAAEREAGSLFPFFSSTPNATEGTFPGCPDIVQGGHICTVICRFAVLSFRPQPDAELPFYGVMYTEFFLFVRSKTLCGIMYVLYTHSRIVILEEESFPTTRIAGILTGVDSPECFKK